MSSSVDEHPAYSGGRGQGRPDTTGIHRYIRHPQFTGFFVAPGVMMTRATIPLPALYCLLLMYCRPARQEEREMGSEFGSEYRDCRTRTTMFIPYVV